MNDTPSEPAPSNLERRDLEAHVDACATRYWHLERQHQAIKRRLWLAIALLIVNTAVATQSVGFQNFLKLIFSP